MAARSRSKHPGAGEQASFPVTRVEGWKHTFPAAPAGAIPSTVFKEDYTLHKRHHYYS